jgi:hypothetical protein
MPKRKATKAENETRFWSKVEKSNGCWIWKSFCDRSGYGQIKIDGVVQYAPRVAYKLLHGSIPKETPFVLHRCDNPSCVNPSHLFLGTQKDNMLDAVSKGRNSHGENHHFTKLKDVQVSEIKILFSIGISQSDLACRFGVRQCHISRIVNGKRRTTINN